mmetsp:Transcript_16303/g.34469  ORF Transcript_16303/g.34469 Transcript_16303/m.34469 type:complete len:245 (+) Transcript_16303:56-790(+)
MAQRDSQVLLRALARSDDDETSGDEIDAQRDACASIAAHAFLDSPLWAAVFAAPEIEEENAARKERRRRLERFFKIYFGILDLSPALRGYCGTGTGDNIAQDGVACTFILRDMGQPLTLWQKLRAGLLKLPFECGFQQTLRLLRYGDVIESEIAKVMGGRHMCSLERMCVAPAKQGCGIGSRLLVEALDNGAFKDLPCILTTQADRNVRFYERMGFRVASEASLFFGQEQIQNWTMIREPNHKR